MALKCDVPGCTYLATANETKCLQHKPRAVPARASLEAEGYSFVSVSEVPTNARYNEAAGNLLAAVKSSALGTAVKVKMGAFKKITLLTAQRYALAGGERIGVRIVGSYGYLWKLSPKELESVNVKAKRLSDARMKKKEASKPVAISTHPQIFHDSLFDIAARAGVYHIPLRVGGARF